MSVCGFEGWQLVLYFLAQAADACRKSHLFDLIYHS